MTNPTKKRKRHTRIRSCWSPVVTPKPFSRNEQCEVTFPASDGINSVTVHLDTWHIRDLLTGLRKAAVIVSNQRKAESESAMECVK